MRSPRDLATGRAAQGGRTRLLLVEDELSTVFALREFFALTGYQVDCAAGLSEAQRLIDAEQYDVVITDLHLTSECGGEGLNVASRARRRNPDACIVMLTAYGADAEPEALRCGVDMYQTKPVELRRLNTYVDLVLRRQPAPWGELDPKWRHH